MVAATEKAIVSMSGEDILGEMNGEVVLSKTAVQSKATLTGLPSQTPVAISMCAFNSAGCSPLTDAQTITPQ